MPTSFNQKKEPDWLQKIKTALMWALTAFMFGSALAFFPSLSSGAMFLFACISAPLEQVQSFLRSKGIRGWIKAILLAVLFVVCIKLYEIR